MPRIISFVFFLLFVVPLYGQQSANELRAENRLKKLAERFAEENVDREKLRQDLLAYLRTYPGTPQYVKAADMIRQMPSPLDHLDPAKIRPLEIFEWQPKELVAILGEHRGRQGSTANCVVYSPDHSVVASSGGHLVRLWETDAKRQLRLLLNLGATNVTCLAISPDSKKLAAGCTGAIYLFDLNGAKSKLRVLIPAGSTSISSLAFEPKGKPILAAASYDTKVRFFDLEKTDPKEMEISLLAKHRQGVTSVAYSPDGAYVASGSDDGTVRLWRYEGTKTDEAAKIEANPKGVKCVSYSKDGRLLAAGCADGTVLIWSMNGAKATPRTSFTAHATAAITSIAFSVGGTSLFSSGSEGLIRQWDISKKAPTKTSEFKGHVGVVSAIALSPDNMTIASSGGDWTVRLWDVVTRRERVPIDGHLSYVHALAFNPDAATISTGSEDRFVKLWSLNGDAPKERAAFKAADSPVYSLAYSHDGRTLAAGDHGSAIHFWNMQPSRPLLTGQIKDLPGYVYGLAFYPDSSRLLAQHSATAGIYDVRQRNRVRLLEADPKGRGINGISLSPDGSRVFAGSGYYLMKGNDYVRNKDGSYVYHDAFIRIWDAETGKLEHQEPSAFPVHGGEFSPDGKQLATGTWEPVFRIWDVRGDDLKESAKYLRESAVLATGGGQPYRFQYSPDARWLLIRGTDNRILVWDVAAKKMRHQWTIPESMANATFASDSRHLAISLSTGVIYVLRLDAFASNSGKQKQ